MIDKKALIALTRKLISIDSQNPPGDEREIACFVKSYLDKLGLKTKFHEFKKNRPNVIAVWGSRDNKHSLLITPHLDTVPVGKNWRYPAFKGVLRGGRLYGLGSTDCKCNIACCLEAIRSLVVSKAVLGYNLLFAATADEECGSDLGLIPLLKKKIIKPSAAVVLDADDFEIITTQKGLLHIKVKIEGKRAHGAYPWLGINAIDIALKALLDLKKYKFPSARNVYLRPPTVNFGTIRGGDKVNIVADWCEFEVDVRFLPGTSSAKIMRDIKKIIVRHTKKFKIEVEGVQKPYSIDCRHSLVSQLAKSFSRSGVCPSIKGSEGATVITFFQDQGLPAVATGFGSGGTAHSINEYVRISNLYKGAQVLERFLKEFRF